MKRILVLWFCLGAVYLVLEGIWRGGWTHIAMLVVGGLCGALVGAINQIPRFYNMRVFSQALIGTAIVLVVELLSGLFLNGLLGLGIWDYTGRFGNVLGQICLPYGILWFALMPLAIWLEDYLRHRLWCEGRYYSLPSIYAELLTGR